VRKSTLYMALCLFLGGAFLCSLVDANIREKTMIERLTSSILLTQELGLTDLALFTEARYTRHPSQADLHSAFQDHPMSFEHFPTGSFVQPPAHLVP